MDTVAFMEDLIHCKATGLFVRILRHLERSTSVVDICVVEYVVWKVLLTSAFHGKMMNICEAKRPFIRDRPGIYSFWEPPSMRLSDDEISSSLVSGDLAIVRFHSMDWLFLLDYSNVLDSRPFSSKVRGRAWVLQLTFGRSRLPDSDGTCIYKMESSGMTGMT